MHESCIFRLISLLTCVLFLFLVVLRRMIGALSRMIHNRSAPEASLVNAYCRMGMARIDTEGLKIPRGFNPDLNNTNLQLQQFLQHILTKRRIKPPVELDPAAVRRAVAMLPVRGHDEHYVDQWLSSAYVQRSKLRGFTFSTAEGEKGKKKKAVANSYFAVDTRELYSYLDGVFPGPHAGILSYGQIVRWLVVEWVRYRKDDMGDMQRQSFGFAQVRIFKSVKRDAKLPNLDVVNLKQNGLVFNYLPVTVIQEPVALAWDPVGFDRHKPPSLATSSGRFIVLPLSS